MRDQGMIQLIIAYTLVGAFVFTVVVTCLSLVGWIKFKDSKQQKKLFSILIVELVAGCVGFFFNFMTLNPGPVVKEIGDRAIVLQKRVDGLLDQVDSLPTKGKAFVSLEQEAARTASAQINNLVQARDPQNRRMTDPDVARQLLKMRIVLDDRDPSTIDRWEAAIRSVRNQP